MPLALRAELDQLRCGEPGCTCDDDGIVIASKCHQDAPMWAVYQHGELTLSCSESWDKRLRACSHGGYLKIQRGLPQTR
jgi:hypothetical protein